MRDGVVRGDKLERVRLQLACDVVALRDELRRIERGLEARLPAQGYLVFATPYGLRPDRPKLEDLSPRPTNLNSIAAFKDHPATVSWPAANGSSHRSHAPDLRVNYQEKCLATCPLAQHCRVLVSECPRSSGGYSPGRQYSPASGVPALTSGTEAPQNDDRGSPLCDSSRGRRYGPHFSGTSEFLAGTRGSLPSARDVPYHSARPSRSAAIPLSPSVSVP